MEKNTPFELQLARLRDHNFSQISKNLSHEAEEKRKEFDEYFVSVRKAKATSNFVKFVNFGTSGWLSILKRSDLLVFYTSQGFHKLKTLTLRWFCIM